MSSRRGDRRDFFISFNRADRVWAEWITAELERNGYTTFFQDWDFRPGSNCVLEMHKAAALADRTIAVLSPDYLSALFTQPEWAASLVQDPAGGERKLIPVRVEPCEPEGLLKAIVYADLVGLSEPDVRARLLGAVSDDRPKPAFLPFPNSGAKPFPGTAPGAGWRPAEKPGPPGEKTSRQWPSDRLWSYGALSMVCFLVGVGLLILMLSKAEMLADLGLTGRLFYLVLIPMALAAAGLLFGVLESVAIFRRQAFGGAVLIGGPFVAAALVVWGGFTLPPPERAAFAMTVYVHGAGGPQDAVLRGRGKVVMDLRGNRRSESIDGKGAAYFPGIPAEFRGQAVPITLDAEGFEAAGGGLGQLTGENLYLAVRRSAERLYGVVWDERGEPVAGASVDVEKFMAKTDTEGRFEITLPGDRVRPEMALDVRASGFQPQTHSVTPGGNEIRMRLERSK